MAQQLAAALPPEEDEALLGAIPMGEALETLAATLGPRFPSPSKKEQQQQQQAASASPSKAQAAAAASAAASPKGEEKKEGNSEPAGAPSLTQEESARLVISREASSRRLLEAERGLPVGAMGGGGSSASLSIGACVRAFVRCVLCVVDSQ